MTRDDHGGEAAQLCVSAWGRLCLGALLLASVPFRFTGTLAKLTVKTGTPQAPPELIEMEERLMQKSAELRAQRAGSR